MGALRRKGRLYWSTRHLLVATETLRSGGGMWHHRQPLASALAASSSHLRVQRQTFRRVQEGLLIRQRQPTTPVSPKKGAGCLRRRRTARNRAAPAGIRMGRRVRRSRERRVCHSQGRICRHSQRRGGSHRRGGSAVAELGRSASRWRSPDSPAVRRVHPH